MGNRALESLSSCKLCLCLFLCVLCVMVAHFHRSWEETAWVQEACTANPVSWHPVWPIINSSPAPPPGGPALTHASDGRRGRHSGSGSSYHHSWPCPLPCIAWRIWSVPVCTTSTCWDWCADGEQSWHCTYYCMCGWAWRISPDAAREKRSNWASRQEGWVSMMCSHFCNPIDMRPRFKVMGALNKVEI